MGASQDRKLSMQAYGSNGACITRLAAGSTMGLTTQGKEEGTLQHLATHCRQDLHERPSHSKIAITGVSCLKGQGKSELRLDKVWD